MHPHSSAQASQQRRLWLLLLSTILIMLYGSLYPFRLQVRPLPESILQIFLASLTQRPGRGDLLVNVLLYMPFGLLCCLTLSSRLWRSIRLVGTVAAGCGLSAAIEVMQIYDVGRVPSLYDLSTNTLGTCLGALPALFGRHFLALPAGITLADPAAAVFAVAWLGYRLVPFVPTLDFQGLKNALKPLLLAPTVNGREVLRHAVSWLLFATLAAAALPERRRVLSLLATFGGIEVARLFLLNARITLAELIGGGLACLLWALPGTHTRLWLGCTALLTTGVIVLEGLQPWTFRTVSTPLHLIPFYGMLGGAMELNVQNLLQKLFLYGGLVWLLARLSGWRIAAAHAVAGLLLAIELAQRFLPGRLAEITDPLMAFGALLLLLTLPARWQSPSPPRRPLCARVPV